MTVKPWEPSGIIAECVNPQRQDVCRALDKKQVLWRWKNSDIQVLAQTLSNYLGTRTSSLLAVNKKHGVPEKFIHREWKRTWVNLDGLKKRVAQTGHSSELLKGLKLVIQAIDAVTTLDDSRVVLSSVEQKKKKKPKAKPGTKHNPSAVHNTERINKLDHRVNDLEQAKDHLGDCVWKLEKWLGRVDKQTTKLRDDVVYGLKKRVERVEKHVDDIEIADQKALHAMAEGKTPLDALAKRVSGIVTQADQLDTKTDDLESRVSVQLDKLDVRINDLEGKHKHLENERREDWGYAKSSREYIADRVWKLEEWRKRVDKQAAQVTVNQTLLGDLNTRLGRLATQADRLDTKTDGLESRVSVVEDTNKWLSWTLAGIIGIRFLSLMLRMLKRK